MTNNFSDLLSGLNPEQRAAVALPAESALILAGAGSGKTRVLTTRIAWLIQSGQMQPSQVLAVTFTNKAAKEMLARLSGMLPINTHGMWIGTFHGLCHRMLRAHYQDAGLQQSFQILDSQDQLSLIKRLMKASSVDEEKYPPRSLQNFINQAKEQGLRASQMEANESFNKIFNTLYATYETQCQRENVLDFSELLLRCYELLQRHDVLREHYQSRFRHILVDEFQDTNVLQYRWLKLLAGPNNAIFAVGDDDQSIYAFRGANVGNMRSFEHEFNVKHLIKLEQNYRSYAHILNAANTLIENNSKRLGKNLRTDLGHGEPIHVFEAASDTQETWWLKEEIRTLVHQGLQYSDIAVLYRSNAQSRTIEHALVSAGVPYRVYGGLRFFDRQEIKHALAYLRLIDNSDDDTAFLRVVNFPTRGIGARSIEQLADIARERQCSLYRAIAYTEGRLADIFGKFVRIIQSIQTAIQTLVLPKIIETVLESSSLLAHYRAEKEGQDRLDNLHELINAAVIFLRENPVDSEGNARQDAVGLPSLSAFLSYASLEAGDAQADTGQAAVQLMTVHAAKGLEFRAVFITGLENGLFPHDNSISERDGLEEERRLMYVAITRARERLYLSYSQSRMLYGQVRYGARSRFLDELPEETLFWIDPLPAHTFEAPGRTRQISAHGGSASFQRERGGNARQFGSSSASSSFGSSSSTPSMYTRQSPSTGPAPVKKGPAYGNDSKYRLGQTVSHSKFGEGTIIGLEGLGAEARAQIRFNRYGTKWLALGIAKLDICA